LRTNIAIKKEGKQQGQQFFQNGWFSQK